MENTVTLSRKTFEVGLDELEKAFNNFDMTKERADIWFKYSCYLDNDQWERKIKNTIKGCHRVPTLADILDVKGYYSETFNAPAYPEYKAEEIPKTEIPEWFKEKIKKVVK